MVVHFGLMRSAHGTVLRGVGGNPRAVERAGWSLLKAKMIMFTFAGLFGMLSGLSLVGLTTSGDAISGQSQSGSPPSRLRMGWAAGAC